MVVVNPVVVVVNAMVVLDALVNDVVVVVVMVVTVEVVVDEIVIVHLSGHQIPFAILFGFPRCKKCKTSVGVP